MTLVQILRKRYKKTKQLTPNALLAGTCGTPLMTYLTTSCKIEAHKMNNQILSSIICVKKLLTAALDSLFGDAPEQTVTFRAVGGLVGSPLLKLM